VIGGDVMAVEKLQEYIDSVDEFDKAYGKVRDYGTIIADVGRYLNNYPYKMVVTNVGFPVTGEREYSLNQDSWPSAQQIGEALADYLKKRDNVKVLYNSLSPAQKESVKPPPNV
jgi:ABC-type sugar transport system substrate-binding protein